MGSFKTFAADVIKVRFGPKTSSYWFVNNWCAEGTPISDPIITNDVLYQLSYSGFSGSKLFLLSALTGRC